MAHSRSFRGFVVYAALLLSVMCGTCLADSKTGGDGDFIIITVCGVPSIILFTDKKTRKALVMPMAFFFAQVEYAALAKTVMSKSPDSLKRIDAAEWTTKKHVCGVSL